MLKMNIEKLDSIILRMEETIVIGLKVYMWYTVLKESVNILGIHIVQMRTAECFFCLALL